MATFVQEDAKGEVGKPWIGFAVRTARNRPGVYVCDVVEGGPAHIAGLRDDDMLVSFGKLPIDDMTSFRAAMKGAKKPGKTVVVVGRRGRDEEFRVNLKVGVKKRVIIEDVPPISTLEEVRAVLKDPAKLQKVSEAAFAAADADCSGLVTQAEFMQAMREWLSPAASRFVTDTELVQNFNSCDTDGTNFLGRREFPGLVQGLLTDMLRNMNVVSDAFTATIGGPEKPWLGFTVRKPRGRKQLFVEEVEEESPATQAGLAANDQILSVGGVAMKTLPKFYEYMAKHLQPDVPLAIKFKRFGRPYTTRLLVGARESTVYKNVKAAYSKEDVARFRTDAECFGVVAEHLFGKADEKAIGVIECTTLVPLLRDWGHIGQTMTETVLTEALSLHDFDESGYINKTQFYELLRTIMTLSARWEEVDKTPKMIVRRKKHTVPVAVNAICNEWYARGYMGGTFRTEGHHTWKRTTNQEHWPHIFVAVHDTLVIEKVKGSPQREVLEPGDEVYIPKGTVYNVSVNNEDYARFMFAVCVGVAEDADRAGLALLHEEVKPASKRHVTLGFKVAPDPSTQELKVSWLSKSREIVLSGLQVGDALVSIDLQPVTTKKDFQDACRRCVAGQFVRVEVTQNGQPLVAHVPAGTSRYNVHFTDDTALSSLDGLEALLADKKQLGQFAKTCFAACDAGDRGVVDREQFSRTLTAVLDTPDTLGGDLAPEELLDMFDKSDAGKAAYVTEGEFKKLVHRVLEKIHSNALVVEAQSRPAVESPPPADLPPMKMKVSKRKAKRGRGRVVRRKVGRRTSGPASEGVAKGAAAPTTTTVTTTTTTTVLVSPKRSAGSKDRTPRSRESADQGVLSPWGNRKRDGAVEDADAEAPQLVAPRGKAPALSHASD